MFQKILCVIAVSIGVGVFPSPICAYQGGALKNHGHTSAAGDGGLLSGLTVSTAGVTGSLFSVGGSTFVVINGRVGISTNTPRALLDFGNGGANQPQIVRLYSSVNSNNIAGIGMDPVFNGVRIFAGGTTNDFVAIGRADATAAQNWTETMRATFGGYVGISTSSPQTTLDVNGGIKAGTATITSQATASILVGTTTSLYHAEFVSSASLDRLNIVNTHPSAAQTTVQLSNMVATTRNWAWTTSQIAGGDMAFRQSANTGGDPLAANGSTRMSIGVTGIISLPSDVTSTGTITQKGAVGCATGVMSTSTGALSGCLASDIRLKKNVSALRYDPSLVEKLRAVSYEWRDRERGVGVRVGFIAQDVKKEFPQAIIPAGSSMLGIDPNAMIAALLSELQNLRKRVAALEAERH